MWQQRLLHQSYKACTLIGGQWASGEPDRRLQLAPEHTASGRLHQSTGFIGRFSRLIPAVNMRSDIGLSAKMGTVVRENPTRCATYNPARDGFHQFVENWPDPDGCVG